MSDYARANIRAFERLTELQEITREDHRHKVWGATLNPGLMERMLKQCQQDKEPTNG